MVIMVIEISDFLSRVEASQYTIFTQKFHASVSKTLNTFGGAIKNRDNNHYLVSFRSVVDAVHCAQEIQHKFKYVTPKHGSFSRRLKIGMCTTDDFNEKAITLATRICEIVKDQVAITSEIKQLFEKATTHAQIDEAIFRVLKPTEETFLTQVMDVIEVHWNDPDFDVAAFCNASGLNYGQLYWRLHKLTGKTPNNFIKEFRLHQAAVLLHNRQGSIAQIANQSGFHSPTYFSECFLSKYGIRPSKYLQQHS